MSKMTARELAIWQLTNEINWGGLHIDIDCAESALYVMDKLKAEAEKELCRLTGGAVETIGQSDKLAQWAAKNGYSLPNMQKPTVVDALADPDCPDHVKDVLQIRQDFGRSSVTKYAAMLARVDRSDSCVRDHLKYYGAGRTGRWSAQGIQTHNFPKPDEGIAFSDIMLAIRTVKLRDPELFAGLFPNSAATLSAMLRPTICAKPGHTFYCIDYSSIEAVLTLWFCGDPGLDLIRQKLCIYRDLAGEIYGIENPQDLPKKSTERQHGKVGVLGGGYGMGGKKLKVTAKTQWGLDLPLNFCEKIIKSYRARYPNVPATWKVLQRAFLHCILYHRDQKLPHGAKFVWGDPFVKLVLPNGRPLHYFKPHVRMEMAPWGEEVPCIYYWAENSQSKKWELTKTYGGKILENIIQGIARDLMCDATLDIDARGDAGRLVMTVHDELVFEVLESLAKRACEIACTIMTQSPTWGRDCPIGVEAWIGPNYKK